MSRTTKPALVILAFVAVSLAAVALPRLATPSFHGTYLPDGIEPVEFTLRAASRGDVSLADFRGRAVVVFFGYTRCPDACPLTMAKLRRSMALLGERRRDVQVVLITADPELDTPEELRAYVQTFDLGFVGLRGERSEIERVARSFGAYVGEPEPGPAAAAAAHADHAAMGHTGHAGAPGDGVARRGEAVAGPRIIPHTTHAFGLDRRGRIRVLWGGDATAKEIAEDLRALRRL